MFKLIFFIFLNVFLSGHECSYIYKSDVKLTPSDIDMIFRRYLKPLRRITGGNDDFFDEDGFPNHNVEVQLEVIGSNVPSVRRMVNMKQMKNLPQRGVKFRKSQHVPEAHPQSHMLPLHPQRHQFMHNNYDPRHIARNGEPESPAAPTEEMPETSVSAASTAALTQPTEASSTTINTLGEQEPDKKPVYIDDLKKALEDFEKKYIAKQKESKMIFGGDTNKDAEIEEGKRPLLKKDLWLALGLKYASGCPETAHSPVQNDLNTSTHGPILSTLENPIEHPHVNISPGLNPRVGRIMQLIKRAILRLKKNPTQASRDTTVALANQTVTAVTVASINHIQSSNQTTTKGLLKKAKV